jgi:hypothetical protein
VYYKPDWEQAKTRLLAWWNHDIVDRCCIAVHAPRRGSDLPAFPDLQQGPWLGGLDEIDDEDAEGIARWWTDPDLNRQRAITWFEHTFFGGEALPITYVNWGAMALAGMLGAPVDFQRSTVWYGPVIHDWATWEWPTDPRNSTTWQTLVAIIDAMAEGAAGRYFVGKPELGNGADVLSLMRGMENLALDLYTEPAHVARGVEVISDAWVSLMEEMHQRLTDINDGGDVLAWMGLWAPGRVDQIACDFSSVISPDMLRRFFLPEIAKMGSWCDFGVYHLDGRACLTNHLDTILAQPGIRAIQFTPGAGSPPTGTPEYLPRYRRILDSGRGLYLLVQPNEVEPLVTSLGPEGLFLRTYVDSQDEAERLLADVGRWSARRDVFGVPLSAR